MVTLTETAVAALEQVLAKNGAAKGLRIAVTDGGCAGHKYGMGLEAEAGEDDLVLTFGPVSVFVDQASQPLLNGIVVDFVESVEGSGFRFDNPNATSTCGCGKSFSSGAGGGTCSTPPQPGGSCGSHTHH